MLLTNYKRELATTLPGGERHLKADALSIARIDGYVTDADIWFEWKIASSNDLVDLLLMHDYVFRSVSAATKRKRLSVWYWPYARADRAEAGNGALGTAVMASIINSLKFDIVDILEPHSDVTPALINNVMVNKHTHFRVVANHRDDYDLYVVAPDLGGIKRAAAVAKGSPTIKFDKTREAGTGKIIGVSCLDSLSNIVTGTKTPCFIIVDDLVDGGGTFVPIALYLKNSCPKCKVVLSVAHAILSKSTDEQIKADGHGLVGIDELYCTNSIRDLDGPGIIQQNLFI